MKMCYCHTSFYKFENGKYYKYYIESGVTKSYWVIYNNSGGYRFFKVSHNCFYDYFISQNELRRNKLKTLKLVNEQE